MHLAKTLHTHKIRFAKAKYILNHNFCSLPITTLSHFVEGTIKK